MSNTRKILAFAGLFAGYLAYSAYTAYKRIRYRFGKIRFVGLQASTLQLSVPFEIYNPTSVNLTVGNFYSDVYLQGAQIGSVVYPVNRTVLAKQVTTFEILINVDLPASIAQSVELLQYSSLQQWVLHFEGSIAVENHNIGISYDFPLSNLV